MKCRNDSCKHNSLAKECMLKKKNIILDDLGVCQFSALSEVLAMIPGRQPNHEITHQLTYEMTESAVDIITQRLLEISGLKNPDLKIKPDSYDDDRPKSPDKGVKYKRKPFRSNAIAIN